jgi:hypothetical protein
VDSKLEDEARKVLTVVSHAHNVFGGDVAPVKPPVFTGDRALEDNLGLGYFGSAAAGYNRVPIATGPADVSGDDDAGDRFADDFVDRLITGGGWTWADGGR